MIQEINVNDEIISVAKTAIYTSITKELENESPSPKRVLGWFMIYDMACDRFLESRGDVASATNQDEVAQKFNNNTNNAVIRKTINSIQEIIDDPKWIKLSQKRDRVRQLAADLKAEIEPMVLNETTEKALNDLSSYIESPSTVMIFPHRSNPSIELTTEGWLSARKAIAQLSNYLAKNESNPQESGRDHASLHEDVEPEKQTVRFTASQTVRFTASDVVNGLLNGAKKTIYVESPSTLMTLLMTFSPSDYLAKHESNFPQESGDKTKLPGLVRTTTPSECLQELIRQRSRQIEIMACQHLISNICMQSESRQSERNKPKNKLESLNSVTDDLPAPLPNPWDEGD